MNAGSNIFHSHVHAFWTNKLEDSNVIFDLRKVKDQCAAADMITRDDTDIGGAFI